MLMRSLLYAAPLVARGYGAGLAVRSMAAASAADADVQTAHEVLDTPKFIEVRKALEQDVRYRVRIGEYLNLCRDNDLTEGEALKYADTLNAAKVIMRFEQSPNFLYLQPEALSKHMHHVLDPEGVAEKIAIEKKTKELNALHEEFEGLDETKQVIDARAHRSATRFMWYAVGAMTVQLGAVARLTWWELSWDIMEPVTYLITYATAIGSLIYFGFTRREYTYENLHDAIARRRQVKYYERSNFPLERYEEVSNRIDELKLDIKRLGATYHPPPHFESPIVESAINPKDDNQPLPA